MSPTCTAFSVIALLGVSSYVSAIGLDAVCSQIASAISSQSAVFPPGTRVDLRSFQRAHR